MSETVTYSGKIKEIYDNVENLNDKLILLFTDQEIELNEKQKENLIDSFYYFDLSDEFVILKNKLFEIVSKDSLGYDDIFTMKETYQGSFEYLVQYYNGGCSFDEALQEAYENLR